MKKKELLDLIVKLEERVSELESERKMVVEIKQTTTPGLVHPVAPYNPPYYTLTDDRVTCFNLPEEMASHRVSKGCIANA